MKRTSCQTKGMGTEPRQGREGMQSLVLFMSLLVRLRHTSAWRFHEICLFMKIFSFRLFDNRLQSSIDGQQISPMATKCNVRLRAL
ncbi:hypothetical protein BJ166DRAFT_509495 [Pestalotiopsis sp. NC0098]|nr:hypothetical protein BJ166DRAFT_509495 [Pestalotiopsis sp. NC0098]